MTLTQWMVCTAVASCLGGCGSVTSRGTDAAASSDPGSGEGSPHPDAGVPADAGGSPSSDAGTPAPPGPKKCSGTGCDNLDPTQSLDASGAACATNATTSTGGSMAADGGTLELRWGPNCMVNWARFTPGASGTKFRIWASRQAPAFDTDKYEFTATARLEEFSNEVYAPTSARACIEQWNGSTWINQVCTPWI